MRLTQKSDYFQYILPEHNVVGDIQAQEILLTESDCIVAKNIIGQAINEIGKLEDTLEKYHIEDLDKFIEGQIAKKRVLNDILWKMEQELAELKQKAIVPKFKRQEHICSFAFGEIREYIVVAYLDNNVTLCENIETSELEWCDNNYLVFTKEEAEQKLDEIKGE